MQGEEAIALFTEHQPRANALASAYCNIINPTCSYLKEDIQSEAMIGLWQACLRFNETTNNTFWTFAYRRIVGSMQDFLRKENQFQSRYVNPKTVIVSLEEQPELSKSGEAVNDENINSTPQTDHRAVIAINEIDTRESLISTLTINGFSQIQTNIIEQYYFFGNSFSQVVADNGLPRTSTYMVLVEGKRTLQEAAAVSAI